MSSRVVKEKFSFKYIFLYDTQSCVREEDDPRDAIIYFYPPSKLEDYQITLCSQLMGVFQFCSKIFSMPSSLALMEDTFAFKVMGSFILVIGAHNRVSANILEDQLRFMFLFLTFNFGDFESLLRNSKIRGGSEYLTTVKKHLDIYLELYGLSNTLSRTLLTNISLSIPKSGKQIQFLSRQLLKGIQNLPGVLGSAIFFKKSLLSSQFDEHMNLILQMMLSSSRLFGKSLQVHFSLPNNMQLQRVFVPKESLKINIDNNGCSTMPCIRKTIDLHSKDFKFKDYKERLMPKDDYSFGKSLHQARSFERLSVAEFKNKLRRSMSLDCLPFTDSHSLDRSCNSDINEREIEVKVVQNHLNLLFDKLDCNSQRDMFKDTQPIHHIVTDVDCNIANDIDYTSPQNHEEVCLCLQNIGNIKIYTVATKHLINFDGISSLSNLGREVSKLERMLQFKNEQMFGEYSEGQLLYLNSCNSLFDHSQDKQFDIDTISNMRQSFESDLTEEIIRLDDMVMYGVKQGQHQAFYQHIAPRERPGLPSTHDIIAKIQNKARKKLEKEEKLILL